MTFYKKNKYSSTKIEHSGRSFASKLEAAVYDILYLRMKAGEFSEIQQQDTVYLTDAKIAYKPDYKCIKSDGIAFWVEPKGFETPEWRIKRRLWMHYGPGDLEVWMGSYTKPFLKEILKGKL